jgi:hypothetical protein
MLNLGDFGFPDTKIPTKFKMSRWRNAPSERRCATA